MSKIEKYLIDSNVIDFSKFKKLKKSKDDEDIRQDIRKWRKIEDYVREIKKEADFFVRGLTKLDEFFNKLHFLIDKIKKERRK